MTGNIIGEPSPTFLINQLKVRQAVYGSGFDSTNRTTEELLYLNNRNAWIKMASSVSIENSDLRVPLGITNPAAFSGKNLAKSAILFNGLSSVGFGVLRQREGVNVGATAIIDSAYNNSVYGLGGNQFGIQPMPGINSVKIDSKNRGSIRNATVEVTAFNRFQFEIIETLYLRLGFTMLIEWGWDKYIDNNNILQKTGTTFTENGFFYSRNQDKALKQIQGYQQIYQGNYDGFFGRVVNFNWSFESDGSYKISIKLSGLGDVIESLKINNSPDDNLKNELAGIDLGTEKNPNRLGFLKNAKSPIYTSKADTKLGAILYKKLYGEDNFGVPTEGSDYFNLFKAIEGNSTYNGEGSTTRHDKLDKKYCYYISFGELCNLIEKNIVPDVNKESSKQLSFDLDPDKTICSYMPNLISFDPRVCIINMNGGESPSIDGAVPISFNQDTVSGIDFPTYTSALKPFAHKLAGEDSGRQIYKIKYQYTSFGGSKFELSTLSLQKYKNGKYKDLNGNLKNLPGKFISQELTDGKEFNSSNIIAGDVLFGKIYNIYLNYDTIFQSLKSNSDSKGKLTLFKFLKDICDKINSAFGNVIDIEPIIKDDKVITFLDQKPIVGLTRRISSFVSNLPEEIANIQVLGFNPNSTTPEGSLLKSISFNTKLSSKVANQLSIGATARGVAVGEDSTGFSNWNRGLVDRFQETIDDPEVKNEGSGGAGSGGGTKEPEYYEYRGDRILKSQLKNLTTRQKELTVEFEYETWATRRGTSRGRRLQYGKTTVTGKVDAETGILLEDLVCNPSANGYKTFYRKGTSMSTLYAASTDRGYRLQSRAVVDNGGDNERAQYTYTEIAKVIAQAYGSNFTRTFEDNWGDDSLTTATKTDEDQEEKIRLDKKRKLAEVNYSAYLALMFGGKPETTNEEEGEAGIKSEEVDPADSLYLVIKGEENFSGTGKASYKTYLEEYSAKRFGGGGEDSKSPSNQIGLIPVEFDMELDGISGFRIYNKIDINQRFLPSNYAESLEFLVKGLNHKIDSSGWSTNLQTLSTSNLNSSSVKQNKGNKPKRRSKPTTSSSSSRPPQIYEGSPQLKPIKDLIAQFESNGDYAVANQGDRGRYRISTTDVTTKTVNELLNGLSTTYSDKQVTDVVFAMGRYQVIPKVLKEAITAGAVKENDLFDQKHQEQVCDYLLLSKRRKQIGKYLSGENAGTKRELELAIDGLGQEWASMPVVSKTAKSNEKVGNVVAGTGKAGYYGGDGINPTVSKTDVRTAVQKMIESRIKYSGKTPEFIPSYVTV